MTATVVGFDVSLARTGWAVLAWDTGTLVRCGVIETDPRDPFAARLWNLHTAAGEVAWWRSQSDGARLADIGIEAGIHRGSGAVTRKLAACWGAVLLAVLDMTGIEADTEHPTPAEVKHLATGKGNATKAEVMAAACERWGSPAADADIADACWVAEFVRLSRVGQTGYEEE
jgi:Holliday junction resolvasome RuvABC endonuclease subunit